MNILFHVTAPVTPLSGVDAVLQEVELLRHRFGGEIVYLLPSSTPVTRIPRIFYGLHRIPSIRRLEPSVDVHHVFNPDLFMFPFLRLLRKPIILTVVSGLTARTRRPSRRALHRLAGIVVPTSHDLSLLETWGVQNGHAVRPGIDLARFPPSPPPPLRDFVVMAGSAPWTDEQFRSKGFDALLRCVQRLPWLRLILLWRGFLLGELRARIEALRVGDRVEVIDERVDVSRVLGRAHAAIVLAESPALIKAYPHSLLEALAVGRPVIVNASVPIASYVRDMACGTVPDQIDVDSISRALMMLRDDYSSYQERAVQVGRRDFSQSRVVDAYADLYRSIAGADRLACRAHEATGPTQGASRD